MGKDVILKINTSTLLLTTTDGQSVKFWIEFESASKFQIEFEFEFELTQFLIS